MIIQHKNNLAVKLHRIILKINDYGVHYKIDDNLQAIISTYYTIMNQKMEVMGNMGIPKI